MKDMVTHLHTHFEPMENHIVVTNTRLHLPFLNYNSLQGDLETLDPSFDNHNRNFLENIQGITR